MEEKIPLLDVQNVRFFSGRSNVPLAEKITHY